MGEPANRQEVIEATEEAMRAFWYTCSTCQGTGVLLAQEVDDVHYPEETCGQCGGRGQLRLRRDPEVDERGRRHYRSADNVGTFRTLIVGKDIHDEEPR
jgi:DnaJ-class molecular chaperone